MVAVEFGGSDVIISAVILSNSSPVLRKMMQHVSDASSTDGYWLQTGTRLCVTRGVARNLLRGDKPEGLGTEDPSGVQGQKTPTGP